MPHNYGVRGAVSRVRESLHHLPDFLYDDCNSVCNDFMQKNAGVHIYVASMSMEATGRQVGNLVS